VQYPSIERRPGAHVSMITLIVVCASGGRSCDDHGGSPDRRIARRLDDCPSSCMYPRARSFEVGRDQGHPDPSEWALSVVHARRVRLHSAAVRWKSWRCSFTMGGIAAWRTLVVGRRQRVFPGRPAPRVLGKIVINRLLRAPDLTINIETRSPRPPPLDLGLPSTPRSSGAGFPSICGPKGPRRRTGRVAPRPLRQ
jgi:hypothetical protein